METETSQIGFKELYYWSNNICFCNSFGNFYAPIHKEKVAKEKAESEKRMSEYYATRPKINHKYIDEEIFDLMLDEAYKGRSAYDNARGWGY